jgi:serine/threonine protein kinase
MAAISTCPDEHELLPIAMGDPADEAMKSHLDACPICRERVERLRAELTALQLDLEGEVKSPSTEPDPAVSHDGKPPGVGTTLTEVVHPTGDADPDPIGPEAVAAARASAEGRADRPGAIGRYLVVDQLDGGAQGQVYRVIHPNLGQAMVLKLGRKPAGEDERASLVAEGRLLADLKPHINLVRIYDLDFHNDLPFLVMEYVDGRNLEDYARDEPVTPRRAAELVAKLAGALAMVHRKGIIHRDIKPRNILIDEVGEPRLIDFGLARLRNAWADPFATTWGGTLAFMAPEQARREDDRTGPRSDLFGLGAVLYFLLTGQPPFVGETQDEIWDRARRCDFEPRALRIAKAPRRLERICLKALAANPNERYATADAMERALKGFLDRPRRVAIAAGLLLVLALAAGFSIRPPAPPNPPTDRGSDATAASNSPRRLFRPTPDESRSEPLHGGITLWVNEPGSGVRRGLRLHQPGAVPIRPGDEVRVEAGVNRPAYLYLFWVGSDGKVAPLYPWKDRDWTKRPDHEDKVEVIELPEVITDTWELPPSAPGLETLVLLAREDSPLPRDADSTLERELAGPRTTWLPDGKNEAIWLENGQAFRLDDQGNSREMPGLATRKSDDPVLRIRRLLKERISTLGSYHRAVIVPNQGDSRALGPVSP